MILNLWCRVEGSDMFKHFSGNVWIEWVFFALTCLTKIFLYSVNYLVSSEPSSALLELCRQQKIYTPLLTASLFSIFHFQTDSMFLISQANKLLVLLAQLFLRNLNSIVWPTVFFFHLKFLGLNYWSNCGKPELRRRSYVRHYENLKRSFTSRMEGLFSTKCWAAASLCSRVYFPTLNVVS